MSNSATATGSERCPICGEEASRPFFTKHGYAIVRCAACATLHVRPIPSDQELEAHYQNPAYFSGDDAQGYLDYGDMHQALEPHFRRRLGRIAGLKPQRGRLLDVGCADGFFLELARAAGWQIAGVEPAQGMARAAGDRLGITVAPSLAALGQGDFDVITMWEVIEHLPRPIEYLAQIRACLRPGGLLMLSTPNAGHWQAVRRPDAWVGFRPPSHLTFLTAGNLEQALQTAGFEQINVQRVGPLPMLPEWLARLSAPLQQSLATGQARAWLPALWAWRAVRLAGWGWHKLAHSGDNIFATLEALAVRPM